MSQNKKYPIGGYAPGNYSNLCIVCGKEFMGDKRAVQCEPCAVEMIEQHNILEEIGLLLDRLTNKTKRELFSILSREMQKQVIGYINVAGKYEPAISENKTFMPLSSFGISTTTFDKKVYFVKFPNNKSLAEMLDDPIEYDNWCKLNLI